MTTDRELLELAAKAANYKVAWEGGCETGWMTGGSWWNPLTDDGDALRLAVKLRLEIGFPNDEVVWSFGRGAPVCRENVGDPLAATRRAIVRAAAEIGKGMK
jgi:hypothetical protein